MRELVAALAAVILLGFVAIIMIGIWWAVQIINDSRKRGWRG